MYVLIVKKGKGRGGGEETPREAATLPQTQPTSILGSSVYARRNKRVPENRVVSYHQRMAAGRASSLHLSSFSAAGSEKSKLLKFRLFFDMWFDTVRLPRARTTTITAATWNNSSSKQQQQQQHRPSPQKRTFFVGSLHPRYRRLRTTVYECDCLLVCRSRLIVFHHQRLLPKHLIYSSLFYFSFFLSALPYQNKYRSASPERSSVLCSSSLV